MKAAQQRKTTTFNPEKTRARWKIVSFCFTLLMLAGCGCQTDVEINTAPVNLIPNGGFETDSDGDRVPDGWVLSPPAWQRTGEDNREGMFSLKLPGAGVNQWCGVTSPEITVSEGDTLQCSIWCRTTHDSTTYSVHLKLQKWDGSEWISLPGVPCGKSTAWTRVFYPKPHLKSFYMVEPGVTKVRVFFSSTRENAVGHDWYVDQVEVFKIHYKDVYYRIRA